ncbi:hypothetical protein [Saccharothrix sp. HUAS TT1]|uniref:hypothetical protein n=1 Tax=unclassified Saccharothrix TaxID=2593673 RepID=UPI00345B6618
MVRLALLIGVALDHTHETPAVEFPGGRIATLDQHLRHRPQRLFDGPSDRYPDVVAPPAAAG